MDKVVHFEIPADDLGRAKKFYQTVFGWELSDVPNMPPGAEYSVIRTVAVDDKNMPRESGAINGGMMQRTPDATGPVIVINVADVEQSLEIITSAGGKVVMPVQKVMDMGLYARVADTEGNVIGVWQEIR